MEDEQHSMTWDVEPFWPDEDEQTTPEESALPLGHSSANSPWAQPLRPPSSAAPEPPSHSAPAQPSPTRPSPDQPSPVRSSPGETAQPPAVPTQPPAVPAQPPAVPAQRNSRSSWASPPARLSTSPENGSGNGHTDAIKPVPPPHIVDATPADEPHDPGIYRPGGPAPRPPAAEPEPHPGPIYRPSAAAPSSVAPSSPAPLVLPPSPPFSLPFATPPSPPFAAPPASPTSPTARSTFPPLTPPPTLIPPGSEPGASRSKPGTSRSEPGTSRSEPDPLAPGSRPRPARQLASWPRLTPDAPELPESAPAPAVPEESLQAQPPREPDPFADLTTLTESTPTADEFARRRMVKPPPPAATMGARGALRKGSLGLIKVSPGKREMEYKQDVDTVRRNFGGLRQVTVVNPKGGAGKTICVLLLAMTFGQKRGGYVLAWDNNETQGTLGMRAQQDFHTHTVRDMLRDLRLFQGAQGRVGDLSQYVRAQGEGMFDVLASDESATAGEMLTAGAFAEIRDVVSRFYKLIVVDTGNNVRAANWQAAIDATDQLVITMSARNDSAETAARMLDHLEQSGRQRLVREAVSVVTMPPTRKDIDLPGIRRHFQARTRAVLLAPYEKPIDSGEPLRYNQLSSATEHAWLKIAASVAEGL
ncbi:chromosome partitioning protein [Actinoplanes sp. NPDC051851]|uniref:MinD/ParA family ATP-binding protein n=1 Tax=Actinoplanes sp. NPDC051851 TaxID=3154753 RepID=UPI003425D0AC